MSDDSAAPGTADELRDVILERYDDFSKRLKQIARYVLDHPNDLALETLAVVAERSGAQQSAIVRFAKALGFTGASPMQRVLRDGLLANHSTLGYGERVRRFNTSLAKKETGESGELLAEFAEGDILALQNLRETIKRSEMSRAVKLIDHAETVYVIGMRRSFPVASYLAYSCLRVGKRTVLVDGVGGLVSQQLHCIDGKDLLIAISYHPYAEETVGAAQAAAKAGAKVLAISDSAVSPIAKLAAQTLEVRESEVRSFRSLTATICLAEALVIGFAFERERNGIRPRKRAVKT
ncbi:MAG TPA: MurR/RpiR family transcriptional regulator [Steroidobacteraceae bacterium]|nr:MurR/RpiR family transcriptional regulator [Steroidobacteraceae bacterium]